MGSLILEKYQALKSKKTKLCSEEIPTILSFKG